MQNPFLAKLDNPDVLDVIEGLLKLCTEKEEEITELTVELETLRLKYEKFVRQSAPIVPESTLEHIAENISGAAEIIKVVIAEGIDVQRLNLNDLLLRNGYEVVGVARDGHEAVEMYRDKMPSLITLDTHLPGIDGYKATKLIKEFDPDAKVVILSRVRDRQMVLEAIMAGASDYICKPYEPCRLLRSLNRILDPHND